MNIVDTYKEDFISYLKKEVTVKEPKNLYAPIHYILQIGGKRLRPILTIMTCDLFEGKPKDAYDAALAIELFHNFTLIHDDIMDSAPIRRGKQTVHEKWDVNTGILSGDAMMILASQCFNKYEPELFKKLILLFNKTALEVCEGQQLDIDFETRNNVTIAEYIRMITYKTSVLVAAAMEMGAIIANVEKSEAEKIYNFGLNLGIAFQLQDDFLDTFGDAATFGKQIGGDILENKKTFLYLKALEVCDKKDKEKLLGFYNTKINFETKTKEVTELFNRSKIAEITTKEIETYTQKAFIILETLSIPESKKEQLKNFGLSLMKRSI
ncbi:MULTISPECIES: polyprenyl synthetase family protein [Flavobacteriaceae]|uniref:Polyprenyl synthetase family protein n=2 Tax=Flavobacteriaceae TaxID=49546 RepID=A0A4Y8ASN8_9FLAO|nr:MULTISPECIES: polyprenyl synthetase family protein [Flavobacteriaceae]TEW74895.1 polyprenyl synthetase family protein [Gramella jeungdoensis]GGK43219.1 isoprenyl synthetase [Lutibacter litoralis]